MNRVKVACRVRPALDVHTGEALGEEPAVEVLSSSNGGERKSLRFEDGLTFTIDHVYDQKSNQEQVFDGVAKPLVEEAFRGFNCTLFSYGQTGSGKTWSMQGVPADDELRGLIPRFTINLFKRVEEEKAKDENKMFLIIHSYNANLTRIHGSI